MRKLKKNSNNEQRVFLTGFMGTGKTSVGVLLAKKMKIPFIDLDEVVEVREFRTIPEIFETEGEKYFREQESLALMAVVASLDKFVMATGGGVVIKKENRDLMRETGTIVRLTADKKEIMKRLGDDSSRPLLDGTGDRSARKTGNKTDKIAMLLKRRDRYYRDCHIRIDTKGKKVERVVREIEGRL